MTGPRRLSATIRFVVLAASLAMVVAGSSLVAQRQPAARTLSEQEMVDMMVGSSIQASRSSNSESLIARVKEAVRQGRTFTMVAADDVPDDWTLVVPSGIGGGGAWDYVRQRTQKQATEA